MEAAGIYWEEAAQFLATAGLMVSVVNPVQIKAYGSSRLTRSKTDAVDAKLIADISLYLGKRGAKPNLSYGPWFYA